MSSSASTAPYPPIVPGSSFLIAYRLQSRPVLLIGGGLIASGRLYYLLEAGARVTIVSPRKGLHPETAYRIDVSNVDDIVYLDREYAGPDDDEIKVRDFDMVLTAIDDVDLSRAVCLAARQAKVPVNVADVPPECDFYFGSQLRRGPLQIMVSTSGRGPKIASLIRKSIEAALPEHIEDAIDRVGALRSELRKRAPGTGGELGKKRMEWMIGVCDAWTLEDLTRLDENTRRRLLDEGWDKGKVLTPAEMGVGTATTVSREWWNPITWTNGMVKDPVRIATVAGIAGVVVGAAGTAIVVLARTRGFGFGRR
jgi:precorrin-2 dehydrogenase/sirohydrochlorin ferrochelatase